MTCPAPLLTDLLVGRQNVADRYDMQIYVFQTGDVHHPVSNEAQGVVPNECLASPGVGSGAGRLIQNLHDHRSTSGRSGLSARGGTRNSGLRHQYVEPTSDRGGEVRRPGNMTSYSP